MHTEVLSGSDERDKNPIPSPVLSCLPLNASPSSGALPIYVWRMTAVESRAKFLVGNEWWEINLFLFLMIICSLECLDLAACLLISIPQECSGLCSVGWCRVSWRGVGWDMMGWVDLLIQEYWMLFALLSWWLLLSTAWQCERAACDVQWYFVILLVRPLIYFALFPISVMSQYEKMCAIISAWVLRQWFEYCSTLGDGSANDKC